MRRAPERRARPAVTSRVSVAWPAQRPSPSRCCPATTTRAPTSSTPCGRSASSQTSGSRRVTRKATSRQRRQDAPLCAFRGLFVATRCTSRASCCALLLCRPFSGGSPGPAGGRAGAWHTPAPGQPLAVPQEAARRLPAAAGPGRGHHLCGRAWRGARPGAGGGGACVVGARGEECGTPLDSCALPVSHAPAVSHRRCTAAACV